MEYNQLYDKIEEFNESAKDVGKVVGIAALLASVTAIGSSVGKLISENSVKKIIKDDKNLKKLIETIEEDKKKLAIVNKKAAEKMDEYTELIKDYNELSVELGKPILKVDISTGEGESETKTSMVRDNSKYDPEKAMKYKHLKMKVQHCHFKRV